MPRSGNKHGQYHAIFLIDVLFTLFLQVNDIPSFLHNVIYSVCPLVHDIVSVLQNVLSSMFLLVQALHCITLLLDSRFVFTVAASKKLLYYETGGISIKLPLTFFCPDAEKSSVHRHEKKKHISQAQTFCNKWTYLLLIFSPIFCWMRSITVLHGSSARLSIKHKQGFITVRDLIQHHANHVIPYIFM